MVKILQGLLESNQNLDLNFSLLTNHLNHLLFSYFPNNKLDNGIIHLKLFSYRNMHLCIGDDSTIVGKFVQNEIPYS